MSLAVVVRKKLGHPPVQRLPAAPALVVGFIAIMLEQQLR
jgi:hypothetical protein